MKLDNRGFAITTVLYGTLILFLMLLTSMLGILSTHRVRMEKLIEEEHGARDIIKQEDDYASYNIEKTMYRSRECKDDHKIFTGWQWSRQKCGVSDYCNVVTKSYAEMNYLTWYHDCGLSYTCGDDRTGSPSYYEYSRKVDGCDTSKDGNPWKAWSDWQEKKIESSSIVDVESKKIYCNEEGECIDRS